MQNKSTENRILTVPNVLSMLRILMIPLFAWLYVARERYRAALAVLVLSGVTDVLDGWLARHFRWVSNLGKALDPIADKLTQLCVLLCLLTRFRGMAIPIGVLVIKEFVAGIMGLLVIRRTGTTYSAVWHGKLNTALLYLMMALHLFWANIPEAVSDLSIAVCVCMMIISGVLYSTHNLRVIRANRKK